MSRVPGLTPRARVACLVLGFAVVLAAGLFHVSRHRAVIRVGYQLGGVMAELRRLEEEERRLNLELSVLTAPARTERLGLELGMVRPSPAAIRVVRGASTVARAP